MISFGLQQKQTWRDVSGAIAHMHKPLERIGYRKAVAHVMRQGAVSHPADEVYQTASYHVGRAGTVTAAAEGTKEQDHLPHAATRLLIALTQREFEFDCD